MRRGNGDGSIFKLSGKRRKPYAVRVTVGWTNDGKQKYKYVGYYETKTLAKNALNEYLVNPQKMLLEKHTLKYVFENMIEKSKFSDGTIKQYQSGFKQLEHLHNRFIKDITLEELEIAIEDHTAATQAKLKKTLANCYKYALKHEYVTRNLADFLEIETAQAAEKKPFTIDEINECWQKLGMYKHNDIVLILLYSGLRISELLYLKKENVDLEAKTIHITKSKTIAGVRTVPIHNTIFDLIQNRYVSSSTYLIENDGKRLPYSTLLSSYWTSSHTIHETRHTFITHLSKRSTDEIAIKKIVGHAMNDITAHYTHRTLEELNIEINKLVYCV